MKNLAYKICITAAVLGLAACSKPSTTASTTTTSTTTDAAAPAAGGGDILASLQNGNGLKPGLWQTAVTVKGMNSPLITKMCLDEGLSKKFADMGTSNPGKMDCTPVTATRSGNVIDVDTQCKSDGLTIDNKMHMELTSDDAYHQTVTQSYTPAMAPPTVTTVDGKFMGACPSSMKAGDLDTGSGTINMYDIEAKNKG